MTRNSVRFAAVVLALAAAGAPAAKPGEAAPAFSVKDTKGATRQLSDFKGKYVVLEWTNPGCPFVQKHYQSGNMQKLQKELTAKGVIWLTVNSAGPGRGGYEGAEKWNARAEKLGSAATALLLDEDGAVGRAFGAKTTPHMFVVDPAGLLLYDGAPDDQRGTDPADIQQAHNYVRAAIEEAMAGKPVTTATTQPYGCGVKY